MDDQDRQKMRMKMTVVLLAGVLALGLVAFIIFNRETGAGTGTTTNDSDFPWVVFMVFIPIFIVPAIAAKQRGDSQRDDMEKPKRRPEYLRTADGDLLEVVEEQEKPKRERSL